MTCQTLKSPAALRTLALPRTHAPPGLPGWLSSPDAMNVGPSTSNSSNNMTRSRNRIFASIIPPPTKKQPWNFTKETLASLDLSKVTILYVPPLNSSINPHLAEFLDGHLESSFPVRKDAALQVCLVLTLAPGQTCTESYSDLGKDSPKKNIQFTDIRIERYIFSSHIYNSFTYNEVDCRRSPQPFEGAASQTINHVTTNHQHPRPSSIRTQWLISSMEWRKAFLGSSKTTRRIWKVQKWKHV